MNQRCKDSGMLQSDSEDGVRVRERGGNGGRGGSEKWGLSKNPTVFFFIHFRRKKKKKKRDGTCERGAIRKAW